MAYQSWLLRMSEIIYVNAEYPLSKMFGTKSVSNVFRFWNICIKIIRYF